jgi:hypothetical protein
MLPKLAAARDAREYQLAIVEMVAHVGDTHATIFNSRPGEPWKLLQDDLWGPAAPAVTVRPIEGDQWSLLSPTHRRPPRALPGET